jgi:hypothetical protein
MRLLGPPSLEVRQSLDPLVPHKIPHKISHLSGIHFFCDNSILVDHIGIDLEYPLGSAAGSRANSNGAFQAVGTAEVAADYQSVKNLDTLFILRRGRTSNLFYGIARHINR